MEISRFYNDEKIWGFRNFGPQTPKRRWELIITENLFLSLDLLLSYRQYEDPSNKSNKKTDKTRNWRLKPLGENFPPNMILEINPNNRQNLTTPSEIVNK